MAFERAGPGLFALGLGLRAALAGALAFVVVALLVRTQLYATALLIALLAAMVVSDIARAASSADVMIERFVEGVAADALERPSRPPWGFSRSAQAIDRALVRMGAARLERERSIEHLRGLVDTVSAALFVVGEDGKVELGNRAARRLAGRTASRLADIPALGAQTAEAIATLRPGGRTVVRLADGRTMLALAATFSAPGAERRRLVSLQGVPGELDAVEHKAWRDLAHILAHEMMNSLTPIVSLSESVPVLLAAGDVEQAKEAVEVIARRSVGLMNFVDGYRRFTELPPPEFAPIAMAGFLADIDRLMGPALRGKGVGYRSEVEPAALVIAADRNLLEQAVINLVKNAAQAAAAAAAQPQVRLSCQVEDGRVVLAVADNGPGVAQQDLERIFVPFFTTRPDGSGVGLSLARQIALAHAGALEVRENSPRGAVFRLVLPG